MNEVVYECNFWETGLDNHFLVLLLLKFFNVVAWSKKKLSALVSHMTQKRFSLLCVRGHLHTFQPFAIVPHRTSGRLSSI